VKINSYRYPEDNYNVNFDRTELSCGRYYRDFLAGGKKNDGATEVGSLISLQEYASLYPIIHFDVSNHVDYTGTGGLHIYFEWQLASDPAKNYLFYFILIEKRKAIMNMQKKQFQMLNTL
jgi:hypothetical protein